MPFLKRIRSFVFILVCIALTVCRDSPQDEKSYLEIARQHIARLQQQFNVRLPGRGLADYPGNAVADIPKAYAMILMAELDRQETRLADQTNDLLINAGYWLLDHADENGDGIAGWGVPIAWDAFGDGSLNPENTEYTIATAIVVHALLDWMERGVGAPRERIIRVVSRALQPYLNPNAHSPSGLLPYSLRKTDQPYDTFNPAAYMAGQMQRFSRIDRLDTAFRLRLASTADATMQVLREGRRINPQNGSWYWNYSIQEDIPNDLPHAAYIIFGIQTYIHHGGALAHLFDEEKILRHLSDFVSPTDAIHGWPVFRSDISLPPRSYGLGMALYLASGETDLETVCQHFISAVEDYHDEKQGYLKYPLGLTDRPPLRVTEYEAYLYRGLMQYILNHDKSDRDVVAIPSPVEATPSSILPARPQNVHGADTVSVPFVELDKSGSSIETILFNPLTHMTTMAVGPFDDIRFDYPGIPVSVLADGHGAYSIFFRTIPHGALWLLKLDETGRIAKQIDIRHRPNAEVIYRTARWHDNILYLVYYDNVSLSNYIATYSLHSGDYRQIEPPVKLPSLEDPAGRTYEMIPAIELKTIDKRLFITGGNLIAEILPNKKISTQRIAGCLRIIETTTTPNGPACLCATSNDAGHPSPYFIHAPAGIDAPPISKDVIPWNLHCRGQQLYFNEIRDRDDLAKMWLYDISRIQQNGWLEFGINNVEGRIPWSQIYYLNGYLDLLYLSTRNQAMHQLFSPVIADIRRRLEIELTLLDQMWGRGYYQTRAFTVDRSPALFAVQTARLLMLLERYLAEVPKPMALKSISAIRRSVLDLENHIEELANEGERSHWIKAGTPYLRWPKGSKFYYDGTPVPYNHQNEWAYAVLVAGRSGNSHVAHVYKNQAVDIISFFLDRIASGGKFPVNGIWDYWWGTAYDGWSVQDNVSENLPEYAGDKGNAWISFRSIDASATLAAADYFIPPKRTRAMTSISSLTSRGLLYPFVSYELMRHGESVRIRNDVATGYARVSSPWEIRNAVWAYFAIVNDMIAVSN